MMMFEFLRYFSISFSADCCRSNHFSYWSRLSCPDEPDLLFSSFASSSGLI